MTPRTAALRRATPAGLPDPTGTTEPTAFLLALIERGSLGDVGIRGSAGRILPEYGPGVTDGPVVTPAEF